MSKKRETGTSLTARPGYDVGYAKPPKSSQFKPGQSGNPRGRPKGAKNKRPGLHEERLKDIILDEAYRGIAVRDGDRNVTLPMAQAVVRSIAVNAAKGQHRAQRLFAEMLAGTESSRKVLNDQWLDTAIGYKVEWDKELRRREALGSTDLPEPIPHPDHVEIDFDKGTAHIIGPMTKEEKAEFDDLVANKHLLIEDLRDINAARENTSDPKELRKLEREWDDKLNLIALINRLSPKTEMEQ
ncbi:DUF5681 domain-containing protein [Marimonas arenosa]|uniref:DUF5681 domain-containing protein n=1 Tax=Marimonas arenosa TaxID=1795305 RepID=A0AAE3W9A5_9RHOB|nr:DUF5681 domain-containing protein [Marimonas arenosa]MDQ2088981.1 DUF5681 domain-containing protein [Marimonas arenosa]